MEEDRLFEAMGLVKDKLKPEFREFLNVLEDISTSVNYLDYDDWSDYFENGLEAELMEDMKEFI